jgi:hypothetical protein
MGGSGRVWLIAARWVGAAFVCAGCATGESSLEGPWVPGAGAHDAGVLGYEAGAGVPPELDASRPAEGGGFGVDPGPDAGRGIDAATSDDDSSASDAGGDAADDAALDAALDASVAVDAPAPDAPSAPGVLDAGDVCPSNALYAAAAAAAVASLKPTLCLGGLCPTGQCCYEQLSPVNVCVPR